MSYSYYKGQPDEETRQQFATWHIQGLQRAVADNDGDKAKQFQMLLNSFREFGELYDRGARWRDYGRVAA